MKLNNYLKSIRRQGLVILFDWQKFIVESFAKFQVRPSLDKRSFVDNGYVQISIEFRA